MDVIPNPTHKSLDAIQSIEFAAEIISRPRSFILYISCEENKSVVICQVIFFFSADKIELMNYKIK
jgi:hypothetical protein